MAAWRRQTKAVKRVKVLLKWVVILALIGILALFGQSYIRDHPQDFPWTELSLNDPIGYFTGRKLAGLDGDFARCQSLLDDAGVSYQRFPPTGSDQCRRDDNVSLLTVGAGRISLVPSVVAPSCPVAAALKVWEDQVVQPAAIAAFNQKVVRIRHFGAYSCRAIAGTDRMSEHATANAIDIAAFILEDGTTISLSGHWDADNAQSRFLRQVRDGSCGLFATVLSPDYNAAHADHFHLDQASRGAMGYRLCR